MNRRAWGADDFGDVVARYQRQIYLLSFDLTGNHHDAEDLAQQTFLEAYRGLGEFRGDSSLGTWLRRIAINTHVDHRRSRSEATHRDRPSLDGDRRREAWLAAAEHPAPTPERCTESAAIQRHIDLALQRLSSRERTIFVLRHYHHLKLREIAETLDITEGAVKNILFRAVRRLRDELAFYRAELGLKRTP